MCKRGTRILYIEIHVDFNVIINERNTLYNEHAKMKINISGCVCARGCEIRTHVLKSFTSVCEYYVSSEIHVNFNVIITERNTLKDERVKMKNYYK